LLYEKSTIRFPSIFRCPSTNIKTELLCAAGAIPVIWKMDTKHRIGYAIGIRIDYAKREARCNECTALRAGYNSGTYIVPFEFTCR